MHQSKIRPLSQRRLSGAHRLSLKRPRHMKLKGRVKAPAASTWDKRPGDKFGFGNREGERRADANRILRVAIGLPPTRQDTPA